LGCVNWNYLGLGENLLILFFSVDPLTFLTVGLEAFAGLTDRFAFLAFFAALRVAFEPVAITALPLADLDINLRFPFLALEDRDLSGCALALSSSVLTMVVLGLG